MEDLLEVLYPPESLTKWARILVPTNKESRQVLEASRGYAAEKALLRTIAERDCVSHGAWTMPIFRWRITAERVVPGGWLTRETTQMQPCVVADNSSGFHSRMIEASAAVATLKQCLMVFGEVEGSDLELSRHERKLLDFRKDCAATYRLLVNAQAIEMTVASDEKEWPWLITEGAIECFHHLNTALFYWAQALIYTITNGVPKRSDTRFDHFNLMWYTVCHHLNQADATTVPRAFRDLVSHLFHSVYAKRLCPNYLPLLVKSAERPTNLENTDIAVVCRTARHVQTTVPESAGTLDDEERYLLNGFCEQFGIPDRVNDVADPLAPLATAFRSSGFPAPDWSGYCMPGWMKARDLTNLKILAKKPKPKGK